MTEARVDVCIIGAGPAGTALALRLARLGHAVCLIERQRFPRRRVGESLTPGVWPLLDALGARAEIEAAGFTANRTSLVHWETDAPVRRDHGGAPGLLVDRDRFDAMLLGLARSHGVRILQPAVVHGPRRADGVWRLGVETGDDRLRLEARFLADAGGRSAAVRGSRTFAGPRTVALYAYWRGRALPDAPRIAAGADAWLWGVPLPSGLYNTMAFVDLAALRASGQSPDAEFHRLIAGSLLLDGCRDAELASPVRAADATPYLDGDAIGLDHIKVGEAALALDPLSSSGVQKSLQTALAGAAALNTLLRRPDAGAAARRFYRDLLTEASERHRRWAASHYRRVAERTATPFWIDRAADAADDPVTAPADGLAACVPDTPVGLSAEAALVDVPCLVGDFIAVAPALRHPGLERPVAFLGDVELAPLVRALRPGTRLLDVMRSWPAAIPPSARPPLADWLLRHRILVPLAG